MPRTSARQAGSLRGAAPVSPGWGTAVRLLGCAGDVSVTAGEDCRGPRLRHRLPLLVGLGKAGPLNGLRDLGETTRLPVRNLHETVVELSGRIDRVLHLRLAAPALRGPLLEEAEGVAVAVVEVAQPRFLLGGGDRDDDRPLRQPALLGDVGERAGVAQLFLRQGQVGADEGAPAGDRGDAP